MHVFIYGIIPYDLNCLMYTDILSKSESSVTSDGTCLSFTLYKLNIQSIITHVAEH